MRFILVDRIIEMVPGQRITAIKTMQGDEDIFLDHFPGFPVVPGVLLVEMMAQSAGKCLDAEKRPRGKAMLARISSANFRTWVHPDKKIIIYANIKANAESYATADCRIEVDEKKVSSAELFFTFIKRDKFSSDYTDEVLETFMSGSMRRMDLLTE